MDSRPNCRLHPGFSGCRTFGVFGSLYGKRTEFAEWLKPIRDHKPKCDCGCQTMRFFSEAEWLEHDFKPNVDFRIGPPRPFLTRNYRLQVLKRSDSRRTDHGRKPVFAGKFYATMPLFKPFKLSIPCFSSRFGSLSSPQRRHRTP